MQKVILVGVGDSSCIFENHGDSLALLNFTAKNKTNKKVGFEYYPWYMIFPWFSVVWTLSTIWDYLCRCFSWVVESRSRVLGRYGGSTREEL